MTLRDFADYIPRVLSLLEAIEEATGLGGTLAEDATKAINVAITVALHGDASLADIDETIATLKATIAGNDAKADAAAHAKFDHGGA